MARVALTVEWCIRRVADAFLLIGFGLFVAGVALWSVPAALCVSGVVLFVAGGLEKAREGRQ